MCYWCLNMINFQATPFGSFGLKRALARTEEFLLLKSERNCLIDQVRHFFVVLKGGLGLG